MPHAGFAQRTRAFFAAEALRLVAIVAPSAGDPLHHCQQLARPRALRFSSSRPRLLRACPRARLQRVFACSAPSANRSQRRARTRCFASSSWLPTLSQACSSQIRAQYAETPWRANRTADARAARCSRPRGKETAETKNSHQCKGNDKGNLTCAIFARQEQANMRVNKRGQRQQLDEAAVQEASK